MGNRAVITTEKKEIGVYLHWNGGRDSVEAFLEYCKLREFRSPDQDCYGWARFCQVVANFFGGDGLSVGIDVYTDDDSMSPGDNGIYVIRGWEIVDRIGGPAREQTGHDLKEMLLSIDEAQPERQRLGEFLNGDWVKPNELKIGDEVFAQIYVRGEGFVWKTFPVIGIGEDKVVNGRNVKGVPYIAKLCSDGCPYDMNINNYITETVRVKRD